MKIALCISGYFSNKNGDDLLTTNYIYENILDKHDNIDIFIHSFDKTNENNIKIKYPSSKHCIVDDQIDFIGNLDNKNYEYYKEFQKSYGNNAVNLLESTLSFFYSKSKSVKYALQYSRENNFVYDCIIWCRFDIGIRMKEPFDGFKTDNLIFNPKLDFSYFYSAYWNQLNAGYTDFWNFSNSNNMEIYSELYNYTINDMLILNSEYLKVLNNWPDSDKNNPLLNRFICNDSTEVEPETKIIPNYTTEVEPEHYTLNNSYNSHIIQKFFMIKCGLYYKSKFLDYTYNIEKIYRRYSIENKYCIFLYSHSDYSDVWDLTFGQIKKHINLDEVSIYLCVDKLNNYNLDNRIKVLFYDDKLCYTERVLSNIKNLQYDYILFLHEDWVITNTYNNNYVLELIKFMRKNNILHIRSYKAYGGHKNDPINIRDTNNLNLEKIPNDAGYLISLQPGLWCYQTFVSLYSFNAHRPNLLEIITNEDCSFKNKLTDKFFYENVRLSEDSILFPHIHSITNGKWVISNDSYNKFELLFKEYNINTDIRGVM
jgi:hypothetical protein